MGASLGGDNEDAISTINVTPFVDIILVVLIIFMVTAPMIIKPTINVNLPEAGSGESSKSSELDISLSANGDIYVNGTQMDLEQLSSASKDLFLANPNTQAIISADKDVSHGTVVTVLDTVKMVGIRKFAISINQK